MFVSPILNQPAYYYKQNKKAIKKTQTQNVSFKSDPLTYLGGKIVIESAISGVKAAHLKKFKMDYLKLLENLCDNSTPNKYSNIEIATKIIQLSKTSNKLDKRLARIFVEFWNHAELKDLKRDTITNFSKLDDNDHSIRIAKEHLVTSMFESGEYAQDYFANEFKQMSNKYYDTFKQKLADKALYIPPAYRLPDCPEQYLYNYKLIEALDDRSGVHNSYLVKNIEGIRQLLGLTKGITKNQLTSTKNYAFAYYSHNFIFDGVDYQISSDKTDWQNSLKNYFMACLKSANGDKKELAKSLNIDEPLAEEILKDYKAIAEISATKDINEKQRLYDRRIVDKLKTEVKILPETWYDGVNSYRNTRTRAYGALAFATKAKEMGLEFNLEEISKRLDTEFSKVFKKMDSYDRDFLNATVDKSSEDFLRENFKAL